MEYCKARVCHPGQFQSSRCSRLARPGSELCAVHSPEAEARRQAASRARWREKDDLRRRQEEAREARRRRADLLERLLRASIDWEAILEDLAGTDQALADDVYKESLLLWGQGARPE